MALPTILVNSASGSDSAASGAGPGTALTGTAASTSGTGLVVTLDGSPDLSGVATDGSHVIYLQDATAGNRNFGKITAVDNGAKTVTVANAFGLSLSGLTWAIGGTRASIGATTSRKLFDNNSASGDAMPGWIVQMESGHTESLSTQITLRRSGDVTDGPITLRGDPAAGVQPVLTWTADVKGISSAANIVRIVLSHFTLLNSAGTKTNAQAIEMSGGCIRWTIDRLTIGNPSNGVLRGMSLLGFTRVTHCFIDTCSDEGIVLGGDGIYVAGNFIKNTTNEGILMSSGRSCTVCFNIVKDAGTIGFSLPGDLSTVCFGNVAYSCGSDGIRISSTSAEAVRLINNLLVSNGGYGINYSAGTLARFQGSMNWASHNAFRSNSSGEVTPTGIDEESVTLSGDPFADAANDDFGLNNTAGAGAACKAAGFPGAGVEPIGFSDTVSFTDIGAAQAECAGGGGGGLLTHPGMAGGMRG